MLQRRLFIGIPLSPLLVKKLTREMSAWPEHIFLCTKPSNLHVTLLFLGFIKEEDVPSVCEKVRLACESLEAFEIRFSGITMEPDLDPTQAKMVWLSGEPSEELRKLKQSLEEALSFVISAESKTYRPHVTLARLKRAKWQALSPRPTIEKSMQILEVVEEVIVYESAEVDGKREYVALETIPLL